MHKKVPNFLEEIVKIKKEELSRRARKIQKDSDSEIQRIRQSESMFLKALSNETEKIKLIAEIKFASPTNSNLGKSNELLERAKLYEGAGADAISIITEKYFFKGDLSFVSKIKKEVSFPVLQKDFVIDTQQIYEAKEIGSDALLLIARLVSLEKLNEFVDLCLKLGIEPVVETNNEDDLKKAINTRTRIIAVNARNLETFKIDIANACKILEEIPEYFIKLGFSGINSAKEVSLYKKFGVSGILVGTSLMMAKDITSFIRSLQL